MKKVYFFLIFIFLTTSPSFSKNKEINLPSGCNIQIQSNNFQEIDKLKIKKIEVDIHDYRRWTVNSIRIITNPFRFTPEKYRQRFNASVKVTYENNKNCIYNARVRHSGDAKDHIALLGNSIIQSLDVHLTEGNIRGITRFKLFKPDTRGILEDVILQTEILRSLNYLAPRSIKVDTRINLTTSTMLFQEKASKELLEFNLRREGPILEGDQKFFFKLVESIPSNQLSNYDVGTPKLRSKSIKTMLAKQTNARIINKSKIHEQMSYNSLTNLNLIYLYYSNRFQDKKNNFQFFDYDLDNQLLGFFNKKNIQKLNVYNLLMQSTNSQHALSSSNRKFYWNPILNFYEPINYDSNPDIDRNAPTTTTSEFRMPISENFFDAFEQLEKRLLNLDINELKINISRAGIEEGNEYVETKINKILFNLEKIKNNYLGITDEKFIKHNYFKPLKGIMSRFNKTLTEIDPNVYLIKHSPDGKTLQRCEIYMMNCTDYNFSKINLPFLLEGELVIEDKIYQYVGRNFDSNNLIINKNYKVIDLNFTKIFFESGIMIKSDLDKKIINIYQENPEARLYFIGGKLEDLTLNFFGNNLQQNLDINSLKNYPINLSGLTGCLSLISLEIKNVTLNANNSSCEDAINLIDVKGDLASVNIENSISDGLDVDFSFIDIKNIKIKNSLNDCVDFSSGNYSLGNLNLSFCGDKGLSVGEKSTLNLNKISVQNTDIGIASKDSSITKIKDANIENTKTCVAAYNKKQEFYGGIIEANFINCKNFLKREDIDKHSLIIEKNSKI